MNLYKYYIVHNSVTTEVHPLGFSEDNIDYVREEGQFFFRRFLNGSLIFTDNNQFAPGETPTTDYTLLKTIEDGANRCLEVVVNIQKSCDNGATYEDFWSGYFNVNDGDWNLDRCSVTFKKFEPNDEYRCILSKSEEEVNVLSASPIVETSTMLVTDYEFDVCENCSGCTVSHPAAQGWLLFHQEEINGIDTCIYYREKTVTGCLAGSPNPPTGGGWILASNDCATTGFATYVRTPVTVYDNNPNPDVAPGNCDVDDLPLFPPMKQRLTVTRTNTPVTAEIVGYDKAFASASGYSEEYTFKIKYPNAASTYTWSESGSGWTIVSGQGTDTVVVKFSTANPSVISVVETTICSTAAAVTFNVDVQAATSLFSLTPSADIVGVQNACLNQANISYKVPALPELFNDNILWEFIGGDGGCTIVSGQGTNEVVIDGGDGSVNPVTLRFFAENTTASAGGTISINIQITFSNAARTPVPAGLSSVCPNTQDLTYSIQDRANAIQTWTVSGGTIVSGQGTNSIVVDWDNSTGSGYVEVLEEINCGCTYQLIAPCGPSGEPPFYWCPSATSGTEVLYDQNRTLLDVLTLFSDACSLTEVQSDFFEMNPPGDAPGYVAGYNYVTGELNKVAHIHIAQKSDIIDPDASNPATKGMITFSEMANMLREVFNVFWFIDGTNLRFEHYSYFVRTANPSFDLTSAGLQKWIIGKNKYSYDKAKMPKYERYKWSEASNTDFVGTEISYDSFCVNLDPKSNVLNHLPGNVTTDLAYINSDPTEIDKEGFVLIANDLFGATYVVQSEAGLITGLIKPNMHLSWANLHYNYHRHGRVLLEGNMNNEVTVFLSAKRTKKQVDIKFPYCCADELLPLTELVTTYLGEGEIEKMSFSIKNNTITADLLHDI